MEPVKYLPLHQYCISDKMMVRVPRHALLHEFVLLYPFHPASAYSVISILPMMAAMWALQYPLSSGIITRDLLDQ